MMTSLRGINISAAGVLTAVGLPYLIMSVAALVPVCHYMSELTVLPDALLLLCPWLVVFLLLGLYCKNSEQYLFICSMVLVCLAVFGGSLDLDSAPRILSEMWRILFGAENFSDVRYWIALVLSLTVVIHMEISRSDIVSGFRGLGVIAALLVVADIILGLLFPATLSAVTAACVTAGVFIALLMLIPAMFSFIIGAVSLLTIFFRESAQSIRNDQAEMDVNYRKAPARRRKK
jgi:hypothetical protein